MNDYDPKKYLAQLEAEKAKSNPKLRLLEDVASDVVDLPESKTGNELADILRKRRGFDNLGSNMMPEEELAKRMAGSKLIPEAAEEVGSRMVTPAELKKLAARKSILQKMTRPLASKGLSRAAGLVLGPLGLLASEAADASELGPAKGSRDEIIESARPSEEKAALLRGLDTMDDKLKIQQPTKSPEELDTEERMKMFKIALYAQELRKMKEREEKHKLRIENTRKKVLSDDYMDDVNESLRLANRPTEEEMTDEAYERGNDEAYLRSPEGKAAQAKKARIEALKMLRDEKY